MNGVEFVQTDAAAAKPTPPATPLAPPGELSPPRCDPSPFRAALLFFLALGVIWRVARYARGAPFWRDECYLSISILHLDFTGLFREPLEYGQVAPLGFLWMQRAAFELLGGGEYSLRLASLIASLVTLMLFTLLAREVLSPRGALMAVAIFAVSYRIVRHGAEAKPYAIDALVSVGLIYVAWRWLRQPARWRPAVVASLVAALGAWFSYPSLFVAAGVGACAIVFALRAQAGRAAASCAALTYALIAGGSAATHMLLFASQQSARAAGSWLEDYWAGSFPPLDNLGRLIVWLFDVHTGRMFGYPLGEAYGASTLTTIAFVAGAAVLIRRRQSLAAALLLAPFACTLLAAAMRKYPYGGASRVEMHLAPMICLLAGMGGAWFVEQLGNAKTRETVAKVVGGAMIALFLGGLAGDLFMPMRDKNQDELVKPRMRSLAEDCRGGLVGIVNPRQGSHGPPFGPTFDPTARYYLELYLRGAPCWMQDELCAAPPRWVLAYSSGAGSPNSEVVARWLTERGLRVVSERTVSLSDRWHSVVQVLETLPAAPAESH